MKPWQGTLNVLKCLEAHVSSLGMGFGMLWKVVLRALNHSEVFEGLTGLKASPRRPSRH